MDKDNFIEEITTNYAELFVNTFLIRYSMLKIDKKEILKDIFEVKNILIKKIDQEFLKYINK